MDTFWGSSGRFPDDHLPKLALHLLDSTIDLDEQLHSLALPILLLQLEVLASTRSYLLVLEGNKDLHLPLVLLVLLDLALEVVLLHLVLADDLLDSFASILQSFFGMLQNDSWTH